MKSFGVKISLFWITLFIIIFQLRIMDLNSSHSDDEINDNEASLIPTMKRNKTNFWL